MIYTLEKTLRHCTTKNMIDGASKTLLKGSSIDVYVPDARDKMSHRNCSQKCM